MAIYIALLAPITSYVTLSSTMALFDKVTEIVGNITHGGGSNSVLGVDVSASSVKVVQLRKEHGTAVLETYGELALGPYAELEVGRATNLPEEKLGAAIIDILKEANVTTKNCGVSIPFASSLVQLIDMPPVHIDKLAGMIPIEARKYIPVPIGEVQLDWFVIPEGEKKYFMHSSEEEPEISEEGDAAEQKNSAHVRNLVLLAAIHNDVLRRYGAAFKIAGLSPHFYEIEVFSAVRATLGQHLEPVAILDIGSATTKLYIIELGIVFASHVINKGSQDTTLALANSQNMSVEKAEETKRAMGLVSIDQENADMSRASHTIALTMEYIVEEARLAIQNFQKRNNKAVQKVILIGGGATMKGLPEFVRERIGMETEIANPFKNVHTPAFLEGLLREVGPGFAVATGLALRRLHESE